MRRLRSARRRGERRTQSDRRRGRPRRRDREAYPKIVGGVDAASGERAAAFYRRVLPGVDVVEVANAETAELVKLAETTYRDINIAFANELARYATERDVDVDEAIRLAN